MVVSTGWQIVDGPETMLAPFEHGGTWHYPTQSHRSRHQLYRPNLAHQGRLQKELHYIYPIRGLRPTTTHMVMLAPCCLGTWFPAGQWNSYLSSLTWPAWSLPHPKIGICDGFHQHPAPSPSKKTFWKENYWLILGEFFTTGTLKLNIPEHTQSSVASLCLNFFQKAHGIAVLETHGAFSGCVQ